MRSKKVILPVIVAEVISVGIFGAKAAWAIGNSESRLYKVESVIILQERLRRAAMCQQITR